jgi:hypothetical protein
MTSQCTGGTKVFHCCRPKRVVRQLHHLMAPSEKGRPNPREPELWSFTLCTTLNYPDLKFVRVAEEMSSCYLYLHFGKI